MYDEEVVKCLAASLDVEPDDIMSIKYDLERMQSVHDDTAAMPSSITPNPMVEWANRMISLGEELDLTIPKDLKEMSNV